MFRAEYGRCLRSADQKNTGQAGRAEMFYECKQWFEHDFLIL